MLEATSLAAPGETEAEFLARAHAQLREMAEVAMRAVRLAVERIEHNQKDPDAAEAAPSLTLARAASTVRLAIAQQHRLFHRPTAAHGAAHGATKPKPAAAPSPAIDDPRRAPVREALRAAAAKAEPDRIARNQLCQTIDERLDAALLGDPDRKVIQGDILYAVGRACGLVIDIAKCSDELLGLKPRRFVPDG